MELAERHGMIRGTKPACNSVVTTLGPDIGILSLDCRGERTKHDICQPKTYDIVLNALHTRLPSTVKHLLIATGKMNRLKLTSALICTNSLGRNRCSFDLPTFDAV